MSKIINIEQNCFKGNTCKDNLTGMDMFIGANGLGKSSKIQALLFTILGYVPEQGKNLASSYQFSSDTEMSTKICTDDQLEIERSIRKKISKGQEKLEEDINISPSFKEKTLSKKKERVLSEIGNFPVMLNFQEFIDKSDAQKREFIYSLTESSSLWDKAKVSKFLYDSVLTATAKEDKSFEKLAKKFIDELITKFPDKSNIEISLQILSDWTSNKHVYWKQEVTNTDGTIKKLSEFKNEDTSFGSLLETKKHIDVLQMEIIEEEKKLAVAKNLTASISVKERKLQTLRLELNSLQSKVKDTPEDLLTNINSKIKSLNSQQTNMSDYSKNISDVSHKINDLKNQHTAKVKHLNEVLISGTQKKSEIESIEKMLKQIEQHRGTCVVNCKIGCNKDFSKFISFSEKSIKEQSSIKNNLLKEYNMLNKEIKKLEQLIKSSEDTKENLSRQEREGYVKNSNIQNKISKLNAKAHDIELTSQKIQLKKKEVSDLELEFKKSNPVKSSSVEELEKNINQLKVKFVNIKELANTQQRTKNNMELLKKSQLQNKNAKYLVEISSKILAALGPKGIQGEIIKENLKPLQDTINDNLKLLGIKHKFFFQCETSKGKEVFQFGWINNRKRINFNTLSDGQKALFLIAFLVAIIEKKNPKIKILAIDKIESIDEENFSNLLKGLNKLKDKIDNIILCGRLLDLNLLKEAEQQGFKINDLGKKQKSSIVPINIEEAI